MATSTYTHPGLLHTLSDLNRISARTGTEPWAGGWARLTANGRSGATWTPRPVETVIRGGTGQNYGPLFTDIHAAYQNALRWRISGDEAHGVAAVRILNAWSATLKTVTGNADRFLAAGIYGYQFANAAELVRDRPDFELARFRDMLLSIFHPMNEQFLTDHNGAVITNYWANWDLCNMASILAIGIFTDRDDLVDRAVDYFHTGAGNGSLAHAVPYVHDEGLGQWQESGRDQGHTIMGIGLMGAFCEMAWNQGIDCYGADDNRFLKGAEYVARYNLGHDVPFTPYTWQSGPRATTASHAGWQTQTVPGAGGRGQGRPVWDQVLGHYSGRMGLDTPWVAEIAASLRPDGGGGDYGPNSGGYDQLGFGTLTQYVGTTGRRVTRLQSFNKPRSYVRHAGSVVRLQSTSSPIRPSEFRVVAGLAGTSRGRVSFEAVNAPGHFLRHRGFELRLVRNDRSKEFAAHATFIPVAGLADVRLTSFRAHNLPDRHLRHNGLGLRLDVIRSATARADATFRMVD